jgi:hypothetical protein
MWICFLIRNASEHEKDRDPIQLHILQPNCRAGRLSWPLHRGLVTLHWSRYLYANVAVFGFQRGDKLGGFLGTYIVHMGHFTLHTWVKVRYIILAVCGGRAILASTARVHWGCMSQGWPWLCKAWNCWKPCLASTFGAFLLYNCQVYGFFWRSSLETQLASTVQYEYIGVLTLYTRKVGPWLYKASNLLKTFLRLDIWHLFTLQLSGIWVPFWGASLEALLASTSWPPCSACSG